MRTFGRTTLLGLLVEGAGGIVRAAEVAALIERLTLAADFATPTEIALRGGLKGRTKERLDAPPD